MHFYFNKINNNNSNNNNNHKNKIIENVIIIFIYKIIIIPKTNAPPASSTILQGHGSRSIRCSIFLNLYFNKQFQEIKLLNIRLLLLFLPSTMIIKFR